MKAENVIGPSADDIRKKLLKKWERGLYFTPDPSLFPLSVSLGRISTMDIRDRFDELRHWANLWQEREKSPYSIEYKEVKHRDMGRQQFPSALIFDRPEDIGRYLNRWGEWNRFHELRDVILRSDSRLAHWAEGAPFDLLACGDDLDRLISLWRWMVDHPRPDIYLREIDLPGIDTKFTENYKKLLTQWLDLTLPEMYVKEELTGIKQFEERYGFKRKQELIRVRFFDPEQSWKGCNDLSLPSSDFCHLFSGETPPDNVFVVENDITALTFPFVKKGMVIFGKGYNFNSWEKAEWLKRTSLWYWGDFDTHGFRILDQFRSFFPEAHSFLMDRKTLLDCTTSWGEESKPSTVDLTRLTRDESDLYDDLRFNRIREHLRLEQEFIPMSKILEFLKHQF